MKPYYVCIVQSTMTMNIEKFLDRWFKKTIIPREDNEMYMIRWSLPKKEGWLSKLIGFKIHKIMASDDLCLHDHPWPFISIILKTGYMEYFLDPAWKSGDMRPYVRKHWIGPGRIIYRPAHYIHRLEINAAKPTWTFVVTFKVSRKWGFWSMAGKWFYWREYNSVNHCDA